MLLKSILVGIFRFIHITSGCFIIGNSISDVVWEERSPSQYLLVYIVFGLALLISGVINIIMLKPSEVMKEPDKKIWMYLLYGKAVMWILFIPIPDLITEATGHTFPRKEFNAALVIITLILSVLAKTIRDSTTVKIHD